MDMGGKDNLDPDKRNEDPRSYHSPDWRFNIPNANPIAACRGDLMESSSSCSSASMAADSFCPTIWDHHSTPHSHNLPINVQTNPNIGMATRSPQGMGWNPNSILRGGMFLPPPPAVLPQSLSHFPADSGFIERAARFSCFGGENFVEMMNPFTVPHPMNNNPFRSQPGFKQIPMEQSQRSEVTLGNGCKGDSPLKNEGKSQGEAKQGENDEAELSEGGGAGGQMEPAAMEEIGGGEPSSAEGNGLKKRKRNDQNTELDQVVGSPKPPPETTEPMQKDDHNPALTTNKSKGKQGKHGSQASGSPKEEYIHIRARRGQATNSHSLAERVRREKISERMKFLQDLVPGCSKVTGKAVMLDEIINYVQSLQRQVEFLSMKLATVNPRLDVSIEGLLGKEILHSRPGPSSSLGFLPDMSHMSVPYSSFHPSQPGLIHPTMVNSSDPLQRSTTNSQLTSIAGVYKEVNSQVPNSWEDELHNVVQMGFNSTSSPNTQELSGEKLPDGTEEVEKGTGYGVGIGSVAHELVLSMKRAICPLFIPSCEERSDVLKPRSSGRHLYEASSLSPYCISTLSCRTKTREDGGHRKL